MDSNTSTKGAEGAPSAAELAANDAADLRERTEQAARDDAERAQLAAENAAETAQAVADAAAERVAELESEGGYVTMDLAVSRGIRMDGVVRHYGPGKGIQVPKALADAIASAPTFATSGDHTTDMLVRRKLERDHGVVEETTQEDSTHRALGGTAGGDETEGTSNRKDSRSTGSRTRQTKTYTTAELDGKSAEEVDALYSKAVQSGKIRPIPEGKGSGAEGNVVKADKVAALADDK